jgi:hypothetical protein
MSLAPLRLLALAFPLVLPMSAPIHAMGLTGPFAPANWLLTNTNADESIAGDPLYTCGSLGYDVACIQLNGVATGAWDVIGSAEGYAGGDNSPGALTTDRTTTWSAPVTGLPQIVSFDWLFTNGEPSVDIASYLVSDGVTETETILSTAPTLAVATVSNVLVPSGGRLGYRVATTNTGDPAILSITAFSATPVPGPLPLLGAAMAYGTARQLRRRQRLVMSSSVSVKDALVAPHC